MTNTPQSATPTPPDTSQAPVVSFGSLNTKDPIFFLQGLQPHQLQRIITTAPHHLRNPISENPPAQELLAEIFRLRQIENVQQNAPQSTPAQNLRKVLSTSPSDLMDMAINDPPLLTALMSSAVTADPNLTPQTLPNSPQHLAAIAINWQFEAYKQTSRATPVHEPAPPLPSSGTLARPPPARLRDLLRQTPSQNPHPNLSVRNHATEPNANSSEDEQENEDNAQNQNNPKCPIQPSNFSYGTSASQSNLLQHYPGREHFSTSLAVNELLGPAILTTIIKSGTDIMTFLSNSFKHWKKQYNGQPSNSEMEAITLGRIIHLEMLTHRSPKEALENRPSLEVALRRLYAILYVEETMNQGDHTHKKDAWNDVKDIHETTPQGTITSDEVNESVAKKLNLKRKRLATLKAIRDNHSSSRPPAQQYPRFNRYNQSQTPSNQPHPPSTNPNQTTSNQQTANQPNLNQQPAHQPQAPARYQQGNHPNNTSSYQNQQFSRNQNWNRGPNDRTPHRGG